MKDKKKNAWSTRAAVFSALRRKFKAYDAYKEVRDAAKEEYFVESKKLKLPMRRVHFKCASCGNKFPDDQIRVDHIIPVIATEGLLLQEDGEPDYNDYIRRLFCPKENLQVLCKACHDAKSKNENADRRSKKPKKEKKPRAKKK